MGRYHFKNEDNTTQFLNIYSILHEVPWTCDRNNIRILTPTVTWTRGLGSSPWQEFVKNGISSIILSEKTWNKLKICDEIDIYNEEDNVFIEKTIANGGWNLD